MTIAIIDYGSGNLRSVAKAFEHVSARPVRVVKDAGALRGASHIVLPGVGAFADCMQGLAALPGMLAALEKEVQEHKKKFLGICVGMQMLFERGHEYGVHKGLGWLKGEIVGIRHQALENKDSMPLMPNGSSPLPLKIPHMGWNELQFTGTHPLLANIASGAHAYFVHSYHAECADVSDVIATTPYGQTITAMVARDNIMGMQFHPEKSQETGLQLLKNFIEL